MVLGQADGVGDEAVLELLDLADHLGLLLRGTVVMDDSQTTEQLIRRKGDKRNKVRVNVGLVEKRVCPLL